MLYCVHQPKNTVTSLEVVLILAGHTADLTGSGRLNLCESQKGSVDAEEMDLYKSEKTSLAGSLDMAALNLYESEKNSLAGSLNMAALNLYKSEKNSLAGSLAALDLYMASLQYHNH